MYTQLYNRILMQCKSVKLGIRCVCSLTDESKQWGSPNRFPRFKSTFKKIVVHHSAVSPRNIETIHQVPTPILSKDGIHTLQFKFNSSYQNLVFPKNGYRSSVAGHSQASANCQVKVVESWRPSPSPSPSHRKTLNRWSSPC